MTLAGSAELGSPMSQFLCPVTDEERQARYRVCILHAPAAGALGVAHEEDGLPALLPWSRVKRAIAAEVGEPEGVRTIVFDLVVEDRGGFCVYRLDAEPGEEAMNLARAIDRALDSDRRCPTIKSVATDGIPAAWHPDLRSFEEKALELIEGQG
jgi:hypothetical protein